MQPELLPCGQNLLYGVSKMDVLNVKTLLYAYPRLEDLAEASEVAGENKAYLSFRSNRSALDDCLAVAEEFSLSEKLLHLRDQLSLVVDSLTPEEQYLLEYKYFRRRKILASLSDMVPTYSVRTYFRKQNELLRKVRSRLMFLGWSDRIFENEFGSYPPFVRLKKRLQKEGEGKVFRKEECPLRQNSVLSSPEGEARLLPRRMKTAAATAATHTTQMTAICAALRPPFASGDAPSSGSVETLR